MVACVTAALAALACSGLISAAALAPAPVGVLPLIVLACVACPMLAALELPAAVSVLRERNGAARALAELRRGLDRLPEIEHPLGR